MRKRLIAISYSASKVGVRVDWSPKQFGLVFYAWRDHGNLCKTWWLPSKRIPFYLIWASHMIRRHKMEIEVRENDSLLARRAIFICSCGEDWTLWLNSHSL